MTRPLLGTLGQGSRAVGTGRGSAPASPNMFTEFEIDEVNEVEGAGRIEQMTVLAVVAYIGVTALCTAPTLESNCCITRS